MRVALGFAAIALMVSGCVGGLTAPQGIYAAYGSYAAALDSAATYAESPTANPAVVKRLNSVNKSEPVRKAVEYGRAYSLCQGQSSGVIADVDCSLWDFKAQTASGYATTLRSAVTALLTR